MCIFCNIVNKEINTEIICENDKVIAFNDINPQAPVHVLVIPREHISNANEASDEVFAICMGAARDLATELGLSEDGYRLVINCKNNGGQEVDHLHVHLLGGRKMSWPPG